MGLHNKFPAYFYKRGNLFNTYLGHTDRPPTRATSKPDADPRPTRRPASKRSPLPSTSVPKSAAVRIGEFTRDHMSADETLRFLELVAADCGVSLQSTLRHWQAWLRVSEFASLHLSEERTLRFLQELEQRLLDGRPLIRPL